MRYQSFLLRLWRDDQQPEPVWRGTLEETLTGERRTFTDIADLVAFLHTPPTKDQPPNKIEQIRKNDE